MGCQYPSATPEQGGPPELETVPEIAEQTHYCGRCKETVAPHEFATTMCLDCVFASYTEHANG